MFFSKNYEKNRAVYHIHLAFSSFCPKILFWLLISLRIAMWDDCNEDWVPGDKDVTSFSQPARYSRAESIPKVLDSGPLSAWGHHCAREHPTCPDPRWGYTYSVLRGHWASSHPWLRSLTAWASEMEACPGWGTLSHPHQAPQGQSGAVSQYIYFIPTILASKDRLFKGREILSWEAFWYMDSIEYILLISIVIFPSKIAN